MPSISKLIADLRRSDELRRMWVRRATCEAERAEEHAADLETLQAAAVAVVRDNAGFEDVCALEEVLTAQGVTGLNPADDPDDQAEDCHTCNGSGEGQADGTTCRDCRGAGVVKGGEAC